MSRHTDPKRTLQLIANLEKLGFDDHALKILHHKGANGETIKSHQKFCSNRTRHFEAGRLDSQVQRRLEFVLREYKELGFEEFKEADATDLFCRLAKASVVVIPFKPPRRAKK
jgi:hypothetical protein